MQRNHGLAPIIVVSLVGAAGSTSAGALYNPETSASLISGVSVLALAGLCWVSHTLIVRRRRRFNIHRRLMNG